MAEVKVKVIEEFRDRTKDMELRKKDSVFEVDEERAKILEGLELVEIVKEEKPVEDAAVADEAPTEEVKEEKPAKRGKKK